MGSCFSSPESSRHHRRRNSRSQPRGVSVQYDFYYSTRGDETVLVREPIEQPLPRCQPRCAQHCDTLISVSMNANPPTELGNRRRADADYRRSSQKKKKKIVSRSSQKKKKKKESHRSRRNSRQDTETEAESTWTADDENRYQIALWIGESSRGHGGTNSPQEAVVSGAIETENNEDGVSSAVEDGDGEGVDAAQGSKQPKER